MSTLALLLLLGRVAGDPIASKRVAARPLLTSAKSVHSLTTEEAAKGYPVVVKGIVTASTGWKGTFFVQDKTGGLYVEGSEARKAQLGDEVDITGVTGPGQYAPIVIATKVVLRGQRSLPEASLHSYEDLISGQRDSQLVEVGGIVHSAVVTRSWGRPILLLNLDMGAGTISARILHFDSNYTNLIDAKVRIKGVCGAVFNERRQLIGLRLYVSDISLLKVEQAAPDPFLLPLTALGKLQQFGSPQVIGHRVKVKGTLTFQCVGDSVYLQSGADGIVVKTTSMTALKPGAVVEAAGFVVPASYVPELQDAVIRTVGEGAPVRPTRLLASRAIQASNGAVFAPYHGVLVETEGDVVDVVMHGKKEVLLLRDGDVFFQARIEKPVEQGVAAAISPGTRIRVRGVCLTESDENHEPRAFYLLVGSAAEVVVLHAQWWKAWSFLWILAALVVTIFGLLIWMLRMGRALSVLTEPKLTVEVSHRACVLSQMAGSLATGVGLTVLVGGWMFGFAGLKSLLTGDAVMKPAAALAVVLIGVGVWIESSRLSRSVKFRALAVLTGATCLMVGPSAIHYFVRIDPAAGALALLERVSNLFLSDGPIGFATAFVLVTVCVSLLVLHAGRWQTGAQAALLATGFFSLFNATESLYGAAGSGGLGLGPGMAMPSAVALLLLCFGVLLSHADQGVVGVVTAAAPGGWMARRLLPAAVLIPLVLGWLRWQGQLKGYYDGAFGLTLLVSATIVVFSLLIWTSASLLNTLDVERIRAKKHLVESEASFRQLAEALPQIVWFTNADGRVEYFNNRWYEYTGQTPEEALNWGWQPVLHPDDLGNCLARWRDSTSSGDPYSVEHRFKMASDGEYRWHASRALPLRDSTEKIVRWFGTSTDIHAYKEGEARILAFNQELESRVQERTSQLTAANDELARTQTRLQAVLDSATQVAIIALDGNGTIQLFNAGAEAMLQYPAREVVGRHTPQLFQPPEECEERARKLSERLGQIVTPADIYCAWALGEGPFQREGEFVRRDGSRFEVSVAIAPMIDGKGRRVGTLGIATDVSPRKELESCLQANNLELQRAMRRAEEGSRAKSDFLAIMSHEIRTPLNAIIGSAEILAETNLSAEQSKFVGVLRRASGNLLILISDILDLAKIESGRFELEEAGFDVKELVESTAEMMSPKAHTKGIAFTTRIAPDLPSALIGDPTRLQQVLFNLLANAVKFTERGGVTLAVKVKSMHEGARLGFEISDTGIGIPSNRLDAIFEDFTQADSSTTRRFGGTGLGLGICRRLVRLMGGELTVRSEPEKGSTFSFEVTFGLGWPDEPVQEMPEEDGSEALGALGAAVRRPGDALRVLVADDAEDNRFLVAAYLQAMPYELTFAEDGEQALRSFLTGDFDLVLMDMQMPVMDGFTATRRMRAFEEENGRMRTPILALTANALPEDRERTRMAGLDSHLSKPVAKGQLLEAIRYWGRLGAMAHHVYDGSLTEKVKG